MFKYGNLIYKLQEEQGGDGGDGGGGGEYVPLTQEQHNLMQAELSNQKEQNIAMNGKLNELLGETKKAKKDKQTAEDNQRLESAKKSQSMEDFEAELRSQHEVAMGGVNTEVERLNEIILGGTNKNAITELASLFESPEAGKLMLQNMVKSKHGEGNVVVTNFTDAVGNLITTDKKAMAEWLKNNEIFQPFLKGVDSSGGMDGTGRPATGGSKANVSDKQARIDAINEKFR